jgi:hypothetical protein
MFPGEKRHISPSTCVTFIYYNQYIIIIHRSLSFSLSFLNLIVVPAVSIKLLHSHRITFLILHSIHVHPQVSLSLSSLNLIIVRGIDQITLRFQLLDFQTHAPLNFLLPPRISLALRQQLLVLRDAISG